MKHKNEKGFTLVLSLVLLLVMSLMGGALIVISSGDHQSNNSSDQYQQTFYVAETALLEGEKNLINRMMGPWVSVDSITGPEPGASAEEQAAYANYTAQLTASATGGFARHTDRRDLPRNAMAPTATPCFNSFRNIVRAGIQVTEHIINRNFGTLITPVFENRTELDNLATEAQVEAEKTYLERFRYEWFSVNIGSAPFRGTGSSIKKTTVNVQRQGTAYRIYGCGYMMPNGSDTDEFDDPEIIIPLETVVVLSN
tara:strand:+ start:813 stop:1577 length:765 start_codon:yes stop_codon:yes gene_type:complete